MEVTVVTTVTPRRANHLHQASVRYQQLDFYIFILWMRSVPPKLTGSSREGTEKAKKNSYIKKKIKKN